MTLAAPLPLAANNGGGAASALRRRHPRSLGERYGAVLNTLREAPLKPRPYRSPGMRCARQTATGEGASPNSCTVQGEWPLCSNSQNFQREVWYGSQGPQHLMRNGKTVGVQPASRHLIPSFRHCAVKRAFHTSYVFPDVNSQPRPLRRLFLDKPQGPFFPHGGSYDAVPR